MTFVSYAQNFEDVLLWRALKSVSDGRYLDIGAQSPTVDSVSRSFYLAGWRGVHVEPNPAYAEALRVDRPDETVVQAVVCPRPSLETFFIIPDTGLSTGVREIAEHHEKAGWSSREVAVPTITLASLFDHFAGAPIHWLKIDVEGMEADVLKSWGQHEARPWILVIEATYPLTQEATEAGWIDEVLSRGYVEVHFDGLSRYFVSSDKPELMASFYAPACIFDDFSVTQNHFAARQVREDADRQIDALSAVIADARERVIGSAKLLFAESAFDANRQGSLLQEIDRLRSEMAHHLAMEGEAQQDLTDRLAAQLVAAERAEAAVHIAENRAGDAEHIVSQLRSQLADGQLHMQRLADRVESDRQLHLEMLADLNRQHELSAANLQAQSKREREFLEQALLQAQHQATRDIANWQSEMAALRQDMRQSLDRADREKQDMRRNLAAARSQFIALDARFVQNDERWLTLIHEIDRTPWFGFGRRVRKKIAVFLSRRHSIQHHDQPSSAVSNFSTSEIGDMNDPNQRGFVIPKESDSCSGSRREIMSKCHVNDLLALSGVDFLQAAYRFLLGREMDRDGENHYFAMTYGIVPKLRVLRDIRFSREGAARQHQVVGLDALLRRLRWAKVPFLGALQCASIERSVVPVDAQDRVYVDHFLSFYDRDFVTTVYDRLLGRLPDPDGMQYYLDRLRRGTPRSEIIAQIASSDEAKAVGLKIHGLRWRRAIDIFLSIPVLGGIALLIYLLLFNGRLLADFRAVHNYMYQVGRSMKNNEW